MTGVCDVLHSFIHESSAIRSIECSTSLCCSLHRLDAETDNPVMWQGSVEDFERVLIQRL